MSEFNSVSYDPNTDIFMIYGYRFSGEFFRLLCLNLPIGQKFEIVKRDSKIGDITIREVHELSVDENAIK